MPGTGLLFSRKSHGTLLRTILLLRMVETPDRWRIDRGSLKGPPRVVAELGTGGLSWDLRIAALISGCESCRAFDVVRYANPEAQSERSLMN